MDYNKRSIKHSFLLLIALVLLTGCHSKRTYQGYVEGRFTYIATYYQGKLIKIVVERGSQVQGGQILFALEPQPELSTLNSAIATVSQMRANLADKMKGQRPSELAATIGQIQQVQAQLEYAQKDVQRKQILVEKNAIEQNQLDQAIENLKIAQGSLKQQQANLLTGHLGSREEQIKAAQAQLAGAQSDLEKARWSLQQKNVVAPVNAQVFDIYYRLGEMVPANQAVLSLLAPRDIKVVFFIDEPHLSEIKVGQLVRVLCDGCESDITARISFISPSVEFTPPVIYSRSSRAKLVYEVEAKFDSGKNKQKLPPLHPGLPVDVVVKSNDSY